MVGHMMQANSSQGLCVNTSGSRLQVLRVIPYSAAQLYSYELFKRYFRDPESGSLSVRCRLAAGACAGMASTLVRFSRLTMPKAVTS